jgi:hypothetical protein
MVEEYTFINVANRDIGPITGVNTFRHLWTDVAFDKSVVPSDGFNDQYDKNCRVWSMSSESSRRTFIHLVIRDVVAREEFAGQLRIFCDLPTTVESTAGSKKRKLSGAHDYTIGYVNDEDIHSKWPPLESQIIIVEAKKAWDEDGVWRCIAETSALFKTRKDGMKQDCRVWGICTNSFVWQFLHIDNGGQLWVSDTFYLGLPMVRPELILLVYRFVHHIVSQSFVCAKNDSFGEPARVGAKVSAIRECSAFAIPRS